jgi:hypothetical protein
MAVEIKNGSAKSPRRLHYLLGIKSQKEARGFSPTLAPGSGPANTWGV